METTLIPVVINNRNRLTSLAKLLGWLDGLNVEIIILDNDSTYVPLLEYYKTLPFRVVYLRENLGHTALYQWREHLKFPERYFVYTDSDILPREDCPRDLIDYLLKVKMDYPAFNKIGMGIEIKDIPDCYIFKDQVVIAESLFWNQRQVNLFLADVDTTFAIYDNQNLASKEHCTDNCLRTDYPYVARHLPWYVDSNNLDDEERYYIYKATAVWVGHGRTESGFVGKWTQKMRKKMGGQLIL